MPRERRNEPIPGFTRRLKQAIGRHYPSTTACAEACGLKRETLWTWMCGRAVPSRLDLLESLSDGVGVSIDWLVFGSERSSRSYAGIAVGDRLRVAILDRYESLGACWRALEVRRAHGGSWVNGRAQPHLVYARRLAILCGFSLDWLARGEPWTVTLAGRRDTPERRARVMATRTLRQMADRQIDRDVARVLTRLARNAARPPRVARRDVRQMQLPLVEV